MDSNQKRIKTAFRSATLLFLTAIPVWLFVILPRFPRVPANFSYRADVISLDNFYDEEKKMHLGAQISTTKFYYETIAEEEGILTIRNVFSVHKMTGEKIFSVERIYGIDSKTGRHAKGRGDKDRNGYLFAPSHLQKRDYVYWHINYDKPAPMKFQEEEIIEGLKVHRYAADYHADQTANLTFLPGVPAERGIDLDIHLEQWVEPFSGRMIKYEDHAVCYYYDQKTKERLHPWNKFSNEYSTTSITEQVAIAKQEKRQLILTGRVIPSLLGGGAVLMLVLSFFGWKGRE